MVIDYARLFDYPSSGANPLSLVQVELVARDLYGLMKCFEEIHSPEDLGTGGKKKSKVHWQLRAMYDVAAGMADSFSAPGADRDVQRELKRREAWSKLDSLEIS